MVEARPCWLGVPAVWIGIQNRIYSAICSVTLYAVGPIFGEWCHIDIPFHWPRMIPSILWLNHHCLTLSVYRIIRAFDNYFNIKIYNPERPRLRVVFISWLLIESRRKCSAPGGANYGDVHVGGSSIRTPWKDKKKKTNYFAFLPIGAMAGLAEETRRGEVGD